MQLTEPLMCLLDGKVVGYASAVCFLGFAPQMISPVVRADFSTLHTISPWSAVR